MATNKKIVFYSSEHINGFEIRKRRYGFILKYQEYIKLIKKQKNVCAICKKPEKNKSLAIDHSHSTGKTRGLLCQKCNRGLGCFGDNLIYLKRASVYLENNNSIG